MMKYRKEKRSGRRLLAVVSAFAILSAGCAQETEEAYRQNLKRQNVTDTLPAVITDLRMLPSFYHTMIQDERIEDLSAWINEDEEWKAMIEPAVLDACSEEDGKVL